MSPSSFAVRLLWREFARNVPSPQITSVKTAISFMVQVHPALQLTGARSVAPRARENPNTTLDFTHRRRRRSLRAAISPMPPFSRTECSKHHETD
jgi:hypothetical protein